MSINNLADQISWLLSLKPYVPPAASTPLPLQGSPYNIEEEAAFIAETEATPPAEHARSSLRSENDHRDTCRQAANIRPSIAKDTPDMARLRVAPSPGRKPRLLAQNSCPIPTISSSAARADEKETNKRWHSDGKSIVSRKFEHANLKQFFPRPFNL